MLWGGLSLIFCKTCSLEKQVKYVKKEQKLGPDGEPIQSGLPGWLLGAIIVGILVALFFVGNFTSYKLNDGKTFPSSLSKLFGG